MLNVAFLLQAFILIGWIGWVIQAKGGQLSIIKRFLIVFLIFGIVGILWDTSMRWVDSKQALLTQQIPKLDVKIYPAMLPLIH